MDAHRKHAVRVPGSAQLATCVAGDVCGGDHKETAGCRAGGSGGGGGPPFLLGLCKRWKTAKTRTRNRIKENKNSMCQRRNSLTGEGFG